jgi:predicted metal-dependent hydrolase
MKDLLPWLWLRQGLRYRCLTKGRLTRPHLQQYHIVENQEVPLKLSGGYFHLDKKSLDNADKIFKEFYREKAEQKIKERLKLIEEKFQAKPASIKVLDLQNCWASWTPKDGLNFHWKCAMAPVPVLDYIITHEMVHLLYPNHSKEFWDELDKKMPNYREQENWLKQNGVKLSL